MTSPSERPFLAGASVTGAAHLRQHKPNQDAFKIRQYGYGSVLAAADGVGSERYSQYGSRAVVQAVHETFCAYVRCDLPRRQITRQINQFYAQRLKPRHRDQAATTGIFLAHIYTQGLYLGQIGDGICCGLINGEEFVLSRKADEFSNLVRPLSVRSLDLPWKTKFFPASRLRSVTLMLATDGISEDLLPGKEAQFAAYIAGQVKSGKETLTQTLDNWATPHSADDKTLLLYQYCSEEPGRN